MQYQVLFTVWQAGRSFKDLCHLKWDTRDAAQLYATTKMQMLELALALRGNPLARMIESFEIKDCADLPSTPPAR